mgnify:CR=1
MSLCEVLVLYRGMRSIPRDFHLTKDNWLKERYPSAYVVLEERIAKTNQIADA